MKKILVSLFPSCGISPVPTARSLPCKRLNVTTRFVAGILAVAGFFAIASATAASQTKTFAVTGIESWDGKGSSNNERHTVFLAPGSVVTGVEWDVVLDPINPSWYEEFRVTLSSAESGSNEYNLQPATGQSGGPAPFSGGVAFPDIVIGSDGNLHLEFWESRVDNLGVDGNWVSGALTIHYIPASQTKTFDVTGIESWDGKGSSNNERHTVLLAPGSVVTGVEWDVVLDPITRSYYEEFRVTLSSSQSGSNEYNLQPATGATGGPAPFSGGVAFPDIVIGSDGNLHLEFWESFVDNVNGVDGDWVSGALTIHYLPPAETGGAWNIDADGNWNTVGNWIDHIIASGSNNTAFFTHELTGNRVVTLGEDRTIGNIVFTDGTTSSNDLTIFGADILTLAGTAPSVRVTQVDRNLTIASRIAGTSGLTMRGLGTLTLSGSAAHTFTGGLNLRQGSLDLNYTNFASNLISTQDVTLSGGRLNLSGNSGGTTQNLGNATAIAGGGSILVDPNSGATALNLGSITSTAAGSNLLLGRALGTSGTATLTTTSDTLTNGIYGGRIVYTDGTNFDWATTATASPGPYTISGFTGYTALPMSGLNAATNYSISTATSLTSDQGVVSVNSIKWTFGNFAIGQGNTLVVESGGILMTGNTTAVINSGIITAGATSDYNLTFHTYTTSTTSGTGINNAIIANNGANAVSVTKTGTGIWRMNSGAQEWTGGTYINEGTWFTNSTPTALGKGALHLNGGRLHVASSSANNNNFANQLTSTSVGGDFEILLNPNSAGGFGVVTLGPSLSIGDHTLTVRGGSNITNDNAQVTITGSTTLTGAATFSVLDETGGTSTGTRLILNAVNNNGHLLTVDGNTRGSTTVQGIITDSGGLTKTGAGTLNLNATNDYTGTTTIKGGALALGASGSINGSTSVVIGAGGALNVTAKSSYAIPATQPVTFGISGTSSGTITAGSLDITNAEVTYNIVGTPSASVYVLATYTGLTGTEFASVPTAPTGYTLDYEYEGDKIALVQDSGGSAYGSWSGGLPADEDTNGDGVPNGIAWALGAADQNENALGLLPVIDATSDPNYLIFTFNRSNDAESDSATTIEVEYGDDLVGWAVATHDGDDVIIDVSADTPTSAVEVKLKRATIGASGKIFARLKVTVE